MGEVVKEWSIDEFGLLVEIIIGGLKHSEAYKIAVYNPLGLTQPVNKEVPLQQIFHIVWSSFKRIYQELLDIENVCIHSFHVELSYELIVFYMAVYQGAVLALGYLIENQAVSHEKLLIFDPYSLDFQKLLHYPEIRTSLRANYKKTNLFQNRFKITFLNY